MSAKMALYEHLLTDLLPTQNSDVQQAIQNALTEASSTFSGSKTAEAAALPQHLLLC
jgi:hypothetical protein